MSEKKDKGPPPTANNLIILAGREPPPRLKIIAVESIILFPYSVWPITISSSELATAIYRDRFALLIHSFQEEERNAEIGTLAMVEQMEKHRTKQEYRIMFRCLGRAKIIGLVKLRMPNGYILEEADWMPIPETILNREPQEHATVKVNLGLLTASLAKLCADLKEKFEETKVELEKSGEQAAVQASRHNLDGLEACVAAIQSATSQNIEFGLYRLLDALERTLMDIEQPLPRDIVELLREILWTVKLENQIALTANGIASLYLHLWELVGKTEGKPSDASISPILELLSEPREVPLDPPPVNKEPPAGEWKKLDLSRRSVFFRNGFAFFKTRLVNQDRPIEQLLRIVISVRESLAETKKSEEGAKVGGLFLGPTGTGKTEIVKVLAEFLFGDPRGYIYIEGNSLTERHSVARLSGAEPGYIGYDENQKITQWNLDKAHVLWSLRRDYRGHEDELPHILSQVAELEEELQTPRRGVTRVAKGPILKKLMELTGWQPGRHLGIILIDEIEKAHVNVQHFLLGVLNGGIIQLANEEIVNCENAIFVFTGNIYGQEIAARLSGKKRVGIYPSAGETAENYKLLTHELYKKTLDTAQTVLLPEFLGRIGKEKIRVFHPFTHEDVREILERLRLPKIAEFLRKRNIALFITEGAILFLQKEAWDPTNRSLGARAIKSVLERKVKEEIDLLLDLGYEDPENGVVTGDSISIDAEGKENETGQRLIFKKLIPQSS